MILQLYRALITLFEPLISVYLRRRRQLGKEDPTRFSERRGIAGRSRPSGTLIWLHGASVGEATSVLPLIDRLLTERVDLHVLVTTGTVTSSELMHERLPSRAIHQYVPIDRSRDVQRFLDHWCPDLAVWIESELWPNLIATTHERGIALLLIQARLSERSFRRWTLIGSFAKNLIGRFEICLAQDEVTAERYRRLGADDVRVIGNLKDAAPPLPVNASELTKISAALGERPCWVAASTHAGEEAVVAEALTILRKSHPDLLTIIAPRHPARGSEVVDLFEKSGFATAKRSDGSAIDATNVFVVDTIGELGLFYRLAEIAYIGGSLVTHGGHNPMEAARLGCAVLYGPHMNNFETMVATLRQLEASVEVTDAASLASQVGDLLADDTRRRELIERAKLAAAQGAEAVDRIYEVISARLGDESAPVAPEIPHHARA
jgi:3-deoxy-D-manno-octulosonic-acid transferase